MLAAAVLGWWSWPLGLAVAAFVTLSYLLPPETPVYSEKAPIVEGE